MRLLLALAVLLLVVPFFLTAALDGLRSDEHEYVDVTLDELAAGTWPESRHVRVEGHLVREGPPDDILFASGYYFALVGADEVRDVVMGDGWTPVPGRSPVIACVSGDRLPMEAFLRPTGGARSVVTPAFVLEGSRSRFSSIPNAIAAELGLASDVEVVVIESKSNRIGTAAGAVFGLIGLAFLWWGIRLIRGWRRNKRADRVAREAVRTRRPGSRTDADRPPPLPGAAAPPVASAPRSRRGVDVPWGKVAAVVVIVGVGLAQFARRTGSAATDLARGVAKTADEAAGASRGAAKNAPESGSKLELPSAADVAEAAAGQVSNAKTGIQTGAAMSTSERPTGVERSISLTDEIEESLDRYVRRGATTFELVRRRSVSTLRGRMTYGASQSTTETSTELPDRTRGEFNHVTLSAGEADGNVRLVQTVGVSVEGGYLELFSTAGELEFLYGGTWEDVERGVPCVLRFSERGRAEFAEGMLPLYRHYARVSLDNQGVTEKSVTARWNDSPEYRVATDDDGLEIELVRPAEASLHARFRM